MTKPNWKKHKRDRLMRKQSGLCYYCRCKMIVMPPTHRGRLPDDAATIEHLDDRYSPERGKHFGEYRIVLACNRCNNERNKAREKEVGAAELTRWAKHGLDRKRILRLTGHLLPRNPHAHEQPRSQTSARDPNKDA